MRSAPLYAPSFVFGSMLLLAGNTLMGAIGSAFTYQGRLADGGEVANGSYDLRFSLYDAASGGGQVGLAVTNTSMAISNGVFAVVLDFGTNAFDGESRWLEVGVRKSTNGFTVLSPRQPITPTPYAMTAASLDGPLPEGQLPSGVARLSAHQTFTGSNTFSGVVTAGNAANDFAGRFHGDGSGLTGLDTSVVMAATNDLNTALVAKITASTNDLNAVLSALVTAATNALNTALSAKIVAATNALWIASTNWVVAQGYAATNGLTRKLISYPAPSDGTNYVVDFGTEIVQILATNHITLVQSTNRPAPGWYGECVWYIQGGAVDWTLRVNTNWNGVGTLAASTPYVIASNKLTMVALSARGSSETNVTYAIGGNGLTTGPAWETSDVGAVWSDDFDRAALGTNWVIVNNANVSIAGNELLLSQTNLNLGRRVYYLPWLTSSDRWTLRWSQRFGVLDDNSEGAGVGILNSQAEPGANTRGYNLQLHGAGPHLGQVEIERWDGTYHQNVTYGSAMALAAGDVVDCWLSRSGWTMSATASNRVNGQVSTASFVFSDLVIPHLEAPTISRVCLYPFRGELYVDNVSFTIDRRKPARFVVVGDSIAEGYNATNYANGFVNVIQSNFTQAVCNESSSYNSTSNSVSLLPEILAQQPGTAILMIGGNDLEFGYPTMQWQGQYSNLVAELQANGVKVKHCLPTPRSPFDLRPLKTWITETFPSSDVIDTWTPLVTNSYQLAPAYNSYDLDGVHPNDAGHLLIGQIIRTNLP